MSGLPRYTVQIKPAAEREMDRLPVKTFDRVVLAILSLESNPRPRNCKKLRGVDEYRLRVGDYRILYTIEDSQRRVEIIAVGHRREVYRGI
jgi:mRNA interferase RelE/StbE